MHSEITDNNGANLNLQPAPGQPRLLKTAVPSSLRLVLRYLTRFFLLSRPDQTERLSRRSRSPRKSRRVRRVFFEMP